MLSNIVKIEKLSEEQIVIRGIKTWPIWEKEISRFSHFYDSAEYCLFIEGKVTIETSQGNFHINEGDFVTFPKGLQCVWDIKKPVKKYYYFE